MSKVRCNFCGLPRAEIFPKRAGDFSKLEPEIESNRRREKNLNNILTYL